MSVSRSIARGLLGLAAGTVGFACQGRLYTADPLDAPSARADAETDDTGQVDAGPLDAARVDGGRPDASPPASSIGVFVAAGAVGRTLVSCDDGATFAFDAMESSLGTPITRCGDEDCDAHAGAPSGVVFRGGWFFRATGSPTMPGQLTRSANGLAWETSVLGQSFAALAVSEAGLLAVNDTHARWSTNAGLSFRSLGVTGVAETWRSIALDGRSWAVIGGAAGALVWATHDGSAWSTSTLDCDVARGRAGGLAARGDRVLILGSDGRTCVSVDGGVHFSPGALPDERVPTSTEVVVTTEGFVAWSAGSRLTSADGLTWTAAPTSPSDLRVEAVVRSADGTYVAFEGAYETQRVWRSTDGVVFTRAAAPPGHPIRRLAWGRVPAARACR